MMKSTLRWGVCALSVIAMIALLGGCSKKETATTEEGTGTETATETAAPAVAGTYTAAMASGTASLMLNPDMTASFAMKPMADAPANVENGTWAAGAMANSVDVTFSKEVGDSMMSMTLNFASSGDTLTVTNGEQVGLAGLALVREGGHEGHQH